MKIVLPLLALLLLAPSALADTTSEPETASETPETSDSTDTSSSTLTPSSGTSNASYSTADPGNGCRPYCLSS